MILEVGITRSSQSRITFRTIWRHQALHRLRITPNWDFFFFRLQEWLKNYDTRLHRVGGLFTSVWVLIHPIDLRTQIFFINHKKAFLCFKTLPYLSQKFFPALPGFQFYPQWGNYSLMYKASRNLQSGDPCDLLLNYPEGKVLNNTGGQLLDKG